MKKVSLLLATVFISVSCSVNQGKSNTSASSTQVAAPLFSVAGGTYTTNMPIVISCTTTGADIYYTEDGSDPNNSSTRLLYNAALSISPEKDIIIKAVAVKAGWNNSSVSSVEYDMTTNFQYTETNGSITITNYTGSKTDLNIPSKIDGKTVTVIGEYAFTNLVSLKNLKIPDTVKNIEDEGFENCTNLTNIYVGSSVTNIGSAAFNQCGSLLNITVNGSNTTYTSISGNLFSKDEKTLVQYAIGKQDSNYDIPNSVTDIQNWAFSGGTHLADVTIPDSVLYIDSAAFDSCHSLTNVKIGNAVKIIYNYAFYACSSLHSVTIPDSVISIYNFAFRSCNSLTNVIIGSSVSNIGSSAFAYCGSLTNVRVNATTPPVLGTFTFDHNASGRKFYVPAGTVATYQAAAGWSTYSSDITSQ